MENDFTTSEYEALLCLAKQRYAFVRYQEPEKPERYVLWRHDVDYSLNRALQLAELEHKHGVISTYFVNPHCEFYNILEKEQAEIIHRIRALGHDIGLHFDAAFHDIQLESELDDRIRMESDFLQNWFKIRPLAFSFHNPTSFLLSCEKNQYGGLINTYSKFFKQSVQYCSDSNGYWRFRRLRDVLEMENVPRLQILTHPAWWQAESMTPRERIFRCVEGRALSIIQRYDSALKRDGRENRGCMLTEFDYLQRRLGKKGLLLDLHWMRGERTSVFNEVWRLLCLRMVRMVRIVLYRALSLQFREIREVTGMVLEEMSVHRLAAIVLGMRNEDVLGVHANEFDKWSDIQKRISQGMQRCPNRILEDGIRFVVARTSALDSIQIMESVNSVVKRFGQAVTIDVFRELIRKENAVDRRVHPD